ncbi:hypothetical protein I5M03_27895 [Pseudomonas aeruginosa]|nr:hypothetical protein [Pseudomonas aeruginosa]MBH3778888.1 hypothetical protein [Pseudomonas aeruginosa]
MEQAMREEFEAWVSGRKVCTRYGAKLNTNPDGMYSDYRINDRWQAWKASRAALRVEDEIDRLKAENEELRGALQAVEAEVDGNLRPLTRDLVNMVSGLKNGSHPNDIYEHCDEIERIIGAALEGDKP